VLHGRAAECAHIDGLLADARGGRSGALVVRGEAGIGKSALIEHARGQAAGMTTLSVTGNEFDVEVSYAGLFDLLRPALDVVDELPDPQRDALQSAFAMSAPAPGSRFGVAIGVLGHLSHLAGRSPVLITVDDGQWLDAASVEALAFVARRVAAEGIVVLIAERSVPGSSSLYGGLPTLTLGGLDDDGVSGLLDELGRTAADVGRYRRITAGNPLVIHELVRSGADRVGDEDPLPATEAVRSTFRAQVAPLGERCRRALVFVAAAGQNDVPVLSTVLRANGLAITDLDEAEAGGLLAVDAGRVTFRHPLLRSAVYHDAPPAVRRAVHVGFAEALADLTSPAYAERRVAHLAMAGDLPDEPLAAEMERVGHAAAARSSYATAARMLERSALLSTDADSRARRYLAAASCALPAGRLGDLGRLVEATFAWAGDDTTRMAASHLAYRGSLWQGVPDSVDRFLADEALLRATDPAEAAVIYAEAGLAALMRSDRAGAEQAADRSVELAKDLPGPVRMPGLIVRAAVHAMVLEHDDARAMLREAAPFIAARPGEQWPLIAPFLLFLLDDVHAAAQGLDVVIAAMRRFEVLDLLPNPLLLSSRLQFRRGDWARARITAHEAMSLVSSLGGSTSEAGSLLEPECAAVMALLEAATGNGPECRRHARECLAFGTAHRRDFLVGHGRRAFGVLALGTGEYEAVVMHLRELDEMARANGLADTPMLPWLSDLAEAELATEDPAAAATIARLADQAATIGTPASRGLHLRLHTLASREPDPEALEESAGLLRAVPFESARSRLSAGQVHRRRKQIGAARRQLTGAFDAFDALGAEPWRQRAAAELRACGAAVPEQPAAAADLTPQELQVVRLAVDGESNAHIAATLFLSKKTVEFHLGKAFRKLGVNRRAQLARIPGLTPV
jgi:DNA-binding CsgD family transcriptional regulator